MCEVISFPSLPQLSNSQFNCDFITKISYDGGGGGGGGRHCAPPKKNSYTLFTKASPIIHRILNNKDDSIKIAFTNSELPKIIHTYFYERPLKKQEKTDERGGKGDLWPHLGNYLHYFGIASQIPKSGPDADIMWIIAASKSVEYSRPVSILRPNNADNLWMGYNIITQAKFKHDLGKIWVEIGQRFRWDLPPPFFFLLVKIFCWVLTSRI